MARASRSTYDSGSSAVRRMATDEPPTNRTPQGQPRQTDRAELDPLDPEAVRQRAYEIYLNRGGVNGDPESDWLEAERQLREERARGGPSSGSLGPLGGIG